jgi:hypothetical protein
MYGKFLGPHGLDELQFGKTSYLKRALIERLHVAGVRSQAKLWYSLREQA